MWSDCPPNCTIEIRMNCDLRDGFLSPVFSYDSHHLFFSPFSFPPQFSPVIFARPIADCARKIHSKSHSLIRTYIYTMYFLSHSEVSKTLTNPASLRHIWESKKKNCGSGTVRISKRGNITRAAVRNNVLSSTTEWRRWGSKAGCYWSVEKFANTR